MMICKVFMLWSTNLENTLWSMKAVPFYNRVTHLSLQYLQQGTKNRNRNIFRQLKTPTLYVKRPFSFSVVADPQIREIEASKRNCYFHDEMKLKMHKKYTRANCILECKLDFAFQNTSSVSVLNNKRTNVQISLTSMIVFNYWKIHLLDINVIYLFSK